MQKAIKLGFLFTIVQILISLIISPKVGGLETTYLRLVQWDSYHYMSIAGDGYHLPPGELTAEDVHTNRANVGYFPAYPILARAVHQALGLSIPLSLLFVAQFFCFVFWTLVFLIFQRWNLSRRVGMMAALAILIYPASFFLITGYSESIFLASLAGFLLGAEIWKDQTRGQKMGGFWFLSFFCGVVLTASRLVGIPLVIAPILSLPQFGFKSPKVLGRTLLLAAGSLLGAAAFFSWSYFTFGKWDLYLKLQKLGWGNEPDYLAILYPSSYLPRLFFEDTTTSVCRASNLFVGSLFVWILYQSYKKRISPRWDYFYCAISMFFISISGKASYSMDSMVRYNLPVFVLLVLLISSSLSQVKIESFWSSGWRRRLWILGYLLAAVVQIWMIRVFTKGGWVA